MGSHNASLDHGFSVIDIVTFFSGKFSDWNADSRRNCCCLWNVCAQYSCGWMDGWVVMLVIKAVKNTLEIVHKLEKLELQSDMAAFQAVNPDSVSRRTNVFAIKLAMWRI